MEITKLLTLQDPHRHNDTWWELEILNLTDFIFEDSTGKYIYAFERQAISKTLVFLGFGVFYRVCISFLLSVPWGIPKIRHIIFFWNQARIMLLFLCPRVMLLLLDPYGVVDVVCRFTLAQSHTCQLVQKEWSMKTQCTFRVFPKILNCSKQKHNKE